MDESLADLADKRKILTIMLQKITICIAGVEIPLLNKYTEKIEINCHENGVSDIKPTMRFKGGELK